MTSAIDRLSRMPAGASKRDREKAARAIAQLQKASDELTKEEPET
jgi:hypothetical protein